MPTASSGDRSALNTLSNSQKRRLEQRQDILQTELDLRSEKLKQLRESGAIETGVAVKFQLQKQIQDEEAQMTALESQIEAIEKNLI